MSSTSPQSGIRLAELVATLSLGTDLGLGQPMEHVIRQSLLALQLSEHLGFSETDRRVLYYSGLLAWVGCFSDAHEQAKWFGDDISLKSDAYVVTGSALGYFFSHLGGGKPFTERVRLGFSFIGGGLKEMSDMLSNHCLATAEMATSFGFDREVKDTLVQGFERWDGKQTPLGLKHDSILLTSRLLALCNVVEVWHRLGGVDAAAGAARKRSGTELDPALVALFCEHAPALFATLEQSDSWTAVIAAEPALATVLNDEEFDAALLAMADFIDLKSPFTIGHSAGVAVLATAAARQIGLPDSDVVTLRRAAHAHDFGRLGVSNGIWDKRGPLTASELERVRLHPYFTERMLSFSPSLSKLASIAGQHHERLDGSGYPRGLSGDAIPLESRILAAADAYHAMTELRPYRPALTPTEATAEIRREVLAGRLDGAAVDAVLISAGNRVRRRREWPAGLTAREIEVLRLVARGYSNREVGAALGITPKTASNHIERIYSKSGATNRARAALFAMKHGLMTDFDPFEAI